MTIRRVKTYTGETGYVYQYYSWVVARRCMRPQRNLCST